MKKRKDEGGKVERGERKEERQNEKKGRMKEERQNEEKEMRICRMKGRKKKKSKEK